MASQLYVLNVPLRELAGVVDIFANAVADPAVATLDNHTSDPRPLTPALRAQMLSHERRSTSHQLQGLHAGRENLAMFLWLDADSGTFDAECAFRSIVNTSIGDREHLAGEGVWGLDRSS
jgi:hypothetical protein